MPQVVKDENEINLNFWTENLRNEMIEKNAFENNRFLNILEYESRFQTVKFNVFSKSF